MTLSAFANMPTPAVRNNNPGNLKDPTTGQFRTFASPQEGYNALKHDLQLKLSGASTTGIGPKSSFRQFASVWAPASDKNNPEQYAQKLASQLGQSPDDPIDTVSNRPDDFAHAIAQNEDTTMAQMLKGSIGMGQQNSGLAAKIKAKYPQYADIPDAELEQKILAKYPQYADMASGDQAASPPQTGGGYAPPSPDGQANTASSATGYAPPQEPAPYTPSPEPPPAPPVNPAAEVAKGAFKGLIGGVTSIGDMGNALANQTVGRAANFITGRGFTANDNPDAQTFGNPKQAEQNLQQNLKLENGYQTAGKWGETAAEFLVPGLIGKKAYDATKIPELAEEVAAPKQTLGAVAKDLMSFGKNPRVASDAKAIEPLLEKGLLKSGTDAKTTMKNISTLKKGIVDTTQGLRTRIKSMDVQPTVQPEELNGIFQKQTAEIAKNVPPSGQETANETAKWLWDKFINNLPKGKDLTAGDILDARQKTDAEVEAIKGSNVFDPNTETGFTVALRAMRQGANELLASKAPDQGVKEALKYQTSLYNVLENVAKKGAPAVKKADQLAGMKGISGVLARHPVAAKAGHLGAEALLTTLGLGGAYELKQKLGL